MSAIVGMAFIIAVAQSNESLEARIRAYWDAKISGDAVLAYDYEEVKAKGLAPLSRYVRGTGNLNYQNVDVLNIQVISPEKATALLKMQILVPGMREPLSTTVKDHWVQIDGEWYHSIRKSSLSSGHD